MSNDVHGSVNTDKLFSMLKTSGKNYDLEKIQKAYEYADKLHEGQFRNSGDPYISHPIAVAEIVASLGLDTDSICAAFLHDTVEDCPDKTNLGILRNLFGESVAMLVDGLTKSNMGKRGVRFSNYIGTLFAMVLTSLRITKK